jgi:hypothetical protein
MGLFRRCPGTWLFLLGLCLPMATVAAGCSGTTSAGAEATGTITLDGNPLPNAFISFIPKGNGSSSFANSDGQGNFAVQTSGSVTGLAPGEYVVVVEQGDPSDAETAEAPKGGDSENQTESAAKAEVSGSSSIPAKYRSETTSDLTVTVSEGEQKSIQLDLSSAE